MLDLLEDERAGSPSILLLEGFLVRERDAGRTEGLFVSAKSASGSTGIARRRSRASARGLALRLILGWK